MLIKQMSFFLSYFILGLYLVSIQKLFNIPQTENHTQSGLSVSQNTVQFQNKNI